MEKHRISVRDLVSFNSRCGSLGGTILTSSRALIGTKEHKRIQESRGKNYLKEYSLKTIIERGGLQLEVYGRADGILSKENPPIIEEIKTTTLDTVSEDHLAQVKLYAYIYLIENKLKNITLESVAIKLLYINIITKKEREIRNVFWGEELAIFFNNLASPYLDHLIRNKNWTDKRNDSLKECQFPFPSFRDGQREFSVATYRAIRDGETLFGRAPTGTGKSIATLFPALKFMAEGGCSKIFYLTAKTVGRITAREALNLIRESSSIRSVVLTAKEKICISSEYNCSPDVCTYAQDYYSRVDNGIREMLDNQSDFYQENLQSYGKKFNICPFELSLDISTFSDVIIGDYNYVFDLRVQLKRYFEHGKKDYTLLIDEAHNLPDRLKSSYSVKISREDIPPIINFISKFDSGKKSLEAINNRLLSYLDKYNEPIQQLENIPEDLVKLFRSFVSITESEIIVQDFSGKNFLLDFYYTSLYFIKLSELYTNGHTFLISKTGGLGVSIEIHCIDPSYLFTKQLLKSKSHIFFSATLNPIEFYSNLMLENREYGVVNIPSPFDPKKLKLIIRSDIKTTYRERGRYYWEIAQGIESVIGCKKGNYITYFPSYSFMNEVLQHMSSDVHLQESSMNEGERTEYIKAFDTKSSVLSFAIMGGVFGEGIDLIGSRLIGVIIVGVGLPQISYEGDLLKKTFNYNYAYTFPGFAKVMQAVGRVIRTDEDRGIAILMDSRFNTPLYKSLYPPEWNHLSIVNSSDKMEEELHDFWNN